MIRDRLPYGWQAPFQGSKPERQRGRNLTWTLRGCRILLAVGDLARQRHDPVVRYKGKPLLEERPASHVQLGISTSE